jgi:hypothetical protein
MKKLFALIIFICSIGFLNGQDPVKMDFNKIEVEIGIVERLGDTIPMDLWFLDDSGDTITLDEIIDKPTILSFVYF